MIQTGLLELVGRSDSDWARDSATRQSVTGYLEMDSDSARHILKRRRDQVDSNTSSHDAWQYNNVSSGHEEQHSSRNTLTDCVQEHLRRNWDHAFWIWLVVRTCVLLMVVRTGKTNDDN